MKDEFKPCTRMECFGNRGEGRCRVLTDTMFKNRGGRYPGECCPFYKTYLKVEEWNAKHPAIHWR